MEKSFLFMAENDEACFAAVIAMLQICSRKGGERL